MKKRIFCLLLIFGIMCSSCSLTSKSVNGNNTDADPILENYIEEPAAPEMPIREYGENTAYISLEGSPVIRIMHPTGKVQALNTEIENWVCDITAHYSSETEKSGVSEGAELTVEYHSYVVNETFVGVNMHGVFISPALAHPVDISASFNANLKTGKIVELSDLLGRDGLDMLTEMVTERADIEEVPESDDILKNWVFTNEGIEITLLRGEYTPMSDGTLTVLCTYEELGSIFKIQETAEQEPTKQEESSEELPDIEESVPAVVIDPEKPMIALTFDDGPSKHTDRLLDILAKNGCKGTFFVVGNMLDSRPGTLRRMADEGHEIGGHSWNHRQLTKLDAQEIKEQMMSTRAKIYEITGVDSSIMRPPYGSVDDTVKAVAEELGIALINWSVDTLDWKNRDAEIVYTSTMEQAKNGAIILCHDLHETTVDAMERVVPDLMAEGYQLVTVSDLLGSMEAGRVYFKR